MALSSLKSLLLWSRKRWLTAIGTTLVTGLFISLPTAILKTPIFGREIPVTSWSIPVVIATSILSGMLFATYVSNDSSLKEERSFKIGGAGAFFSFLAVGCPVCNKLVLIALGYSGAIQYFAPVQPYLAGAGILLLAYALQRRLAGEAMCQINYVEKKQEQRLDN